MKRIGIAAIYRRRNTSASHPAHKTCPYLLRSVTTDRPNPVWATDIMYIPMKRGFVFLVASLDWATRKMLAHRVEFTGLLKNNDIQISMDGKGRWVDNVFFERLWKSVKYAHVYLHAYDSVAEAKQQSSSTTLAVHILHSADTRRMPHTAEIANGKRQHDVNRRNFT